MASLPRFGKDRQRAFLSGWWPWEGHYELAVATFGQAHPELPGLVCIEVRFGMTRREQGRLQVLATTVYEAAAPEVGKAGA